MVETTAARWLLKYSVILALLLHPASLRPAEIVVTGACTLVDAIHAANNDDDSDGRCPPGGAGTDTLLLTRNVLLSDVDNSDPWTGNGLPVITTTVIVDGAGFKIERRPKSPDFRIFSVRNGSLTLNDVEVRNGRAGISAYRSFIGLNNSTVAANEGAGIGAYNDRAGSIWVRNSRIEGNGVGVFATGGSLTVDNSVVEDNHSESYGGGLVGDGNLEVATTIVVTQSLITGNSGRFGGGILAYHPYVSVYVDTSTLTDNSATRLGGGIYSKGDLWVGNSTLSGNYAGSFGGGIYVKYSTAMVDSTTLSGNSAGQAGGGLSVAIEPATVSVVNSTVSGNTAVSYGAGIDNYRGDVTVSNTTVVGNVSPQGAGLNGYATSDTLVVDSIVAANTGGSNCFGPILVGAGNFADDGSCPGASPIVPGVDFSEGLADNGGPTWTHALFPGSAAIGGAGTCDRLHDQRGFRRKGRCDAGAFEFGAGPCDAACAANQLLIGELADLRVDGSCRNAVCHDPDGVPPLDFLRTLPELVSGNGYYYLDSGQRDQVVLLSGQQRQALYSSTSIWAVPVLATPFSTVNTLPLVAAPPDQTQGEDGSVQLGTLLDPDDDAPWLVTIRWGDGTEESFTTTTDGDLGSRVHSFPGPGLYEVAVEVAEAGGRGESDSDTVLVAVDPAAVALVPTSLTVQVVEGVKARLAGMFRGPDSPLPSVAASRGRVSVQPARPQGLYFPPTGQTPHHGPPSDSARDGSWFYAVADLDSDGDPDVVAVGAERTVVWLNLGDATLVPHQGLLCCRGFVDLAVSDMDGDADLDIVALGGGTVGIMLNRGDARFDVLPDIRIPESSPAGGITSVSVGDVNGDGYPDLLYTEDDMTNLYPDNLRPGVFLNDGQAGFEPSPFDLPKSRNDISALGDLDNDGDQDLLIDEQVGLNDGLGSFLMLPPVDRPFPFGQPRDMTLGDLDGDGDLDAMVVYRRGMGVLRNDGGGNMTVSWTHRELKPSYVTARVALADVDGDGDLDAWLTHRPDKLWLNLGEGTFRPTEPTPRNPAESRSVVLADFDGDGALDVLERVGGLRLQRPPRPAWEWSLRTTDGPAESGPVTISLPGKAGNIASVTFDLIVDNKPPWIQVYPRGSFTCGEPLIYFVDIRDSLGDRRAGLMQSYRFSIRDLVVLSGNIVPHRFTGTGFTITIPSEVLRGESGRLEMVVEVHDKDGGTASASHTFYVTCNDQKATSGSFGSR